MPRADTRPPTLISHQTVCGSSKESRSTLHYAPIKFTDTHTADFIRACMPASGSKVTNRLRRVTHNADGFIKVIQVERAAVRGLSVCAFLYILRPSCLEIISCHDTSLELDLKYEDYSTECVRGGALRSVIRRCICSDSATGTGRRHKIPLHRPSHPCW